MTTLYFLRRRAPSLGVLLFCVLLVVWLIPSYVYRLPGAPGLGPRFYPYMLAYALVALALIRLSTGLFASAQGTATASHLIEEDEGEPTALNRYLLIGMASFVALYVGILMIGMLPALFVAICCYAWAFQIRSAWRIVLLAALATLVFNLFFKSLISIRFPVSWLDAWLVRLTG